MLFLRRKYNEFIKNSAPYLCRTDKVLFVKCKDISKSLEKSLKGKIIKKCPCIEDVEYSEKGVGKEGILIALRRYRNTLKEGNKVYAIAVRGTRGNPKLFYVSSSNIKLIK